MVLCLGATGAGKTVLLKKLAGGEEVTRYTKIIPTVGINHFDIEIQLMPIDGDDRKKKKDKNRPPVVQVKELGGELAPNWPQYLNQQNERKVVYVIDVSDFTKVSEVAVHLVECFKSLSGGCTGEGDKSSIIILYSKTDLLPERRVNAEIQRYRYLLRLSSLISWYEKSVNVTEYCYSAWTDLAGAPAVKNWLLYTAKESEHR